MAKQKTDQLDELDNLPEGEVEAPVEEQKTKKKKDDNFPTEKELKAMSEEKRNEVLRARARKNAEAPRDLEDLMPSQMTFEEMQSYLKKYKIDFSKNEDSSSLRTKVRELRDSGPKKGPTA